jgi:hypothetical protein
MTLSNRRDAILWLGALIGIYSALCMLQTPFGLSRSTLREPNCILLSVQTATAHSSARGTGSGNGEAVKAREPRVFLIPCLIRAVDTKITRVQLHQTFSKWGKQRKSRSSITCLGTLHIFLEIPSPGLFLPMESVASAAGRAFGCA